MKRPLKELRSKARAVFMLLRSGKDDFVELGQNLVDLSKRQIKRPTLAKDLAIEICHIFNLHPKVAEIYAQAARFLAIIGRDHGIETLEEVVAEEKTLYQYR